MAPTRSAKSPQTILPPSDARQWLADLTLVPKQLESVLNEASRSGYGRLALEIRLHLGEMELRAGERDKARARLTSLENDASAKGRRSRMSAW